MEKEAAVERAVAKALLDEEAKLVKEQARVEESAREKMLRERSKVEEQTEDKLRKMREAVRLSPATHAILKAGETVYQLVPKAVFHTCLRSTASVSDKFGVRTVLISHTSAVTPPLQDSAHRTAQRTADGLG